MNNDKKIAEKINSNVNVIAARFLIAVFVVVAVVTVLSYAGVFLTTREQMNFLMIAAAPSAILGFLVLIWERVRKSNKTKYAICILMCVQAFAVAIAGYSYAGTTILLLPILLASLYPKSKVSGIVSWCMIILGALIPPIALLSGTWDGEYYEFLYNLSFGREMATAILSNDLNDLLTVKEQVAYALRFCSTQNVLIVGGFSVIGRLVYRQGNHSFESQRDVLRLSETDELTGLLNRNCFERRLDEIASFGISGSTCFYFDVNGLHEMNNTKGHKAGDIMLQFVGKQIQNAFGEDNTFRVGGDEYVAFSGKMEAASLPVVKKSLEQAFASQGYHVAIGYAQSAEMVNINDLVQRAEKEMYQAKRIYYSTCDRRR